MSEMDQPTAVVLARINEIGERYKFARGWQTRASEELGMSRAYVSLLLSRRRGKVGTKALVRAGRMADANRFSPMVDAAISLLEASKPTEALAVLKMLRSSR